MKRRNLLKSLLGAPLVGFYKPLFAKPKTNVFYATQKLTLDYPLKDLSNKELKRVLSSWEDTPEKNQKLVDCIGEYINKEIIKYIDAKFKNEIPKNAFETHKISKSAINMRIEYLENNSYDMLRRMIEICVDSLMFKIDNNFGWPKSIKIRNVDVPYYKYDGILKKEKRFGFTTSVSYMKNDQ